MKIAIAIQTCASYTERRQSIRESWFKAIPSNVDVDFYVGRSNCRDAVVLDCDDGYADCSLKQFEMIKKVQDFDYAFFCDDDTYVVVDRLLNSGFESCDYTGFPCYVAERKMMMAQGGAGFWMSRKAMKAALVVGIDHPKFGKTIFSDWTVASLMNIAGIPLHGDFRYNMGKYHDYNKGFCNFTPTRKNCYITTHFVTPFLIKVIEDHFKYNTPVRHNQYMMNFHDTDVIIAEKLDGTWSFGIGRDYYDGFSMAHEAEEKAERRAALNRGLFERAIL
jgi:hypothetical protein